MALTGNAASEVSCTFYHQPLTEALRTIEMLCGQEVTINFTLRKLEDYTVTTTITAASPLEAVQQVVGFYPISVRQHGSVIVVQPLVESSSKVIGRLVDTDGSGVGFASVRVLRADSSIVAAGVSNVRGDFVIPLNAPSPLLLCASCLGYHSVCIPVAAGKACDILMKANPLWLEGVSATADRRAITSTGAVTHIRVAGTPYAHIGTLPDLLSYLPIDITSMPGLSRSTAYYLNGREITDQSQLASLLSSDISSITIDNAPGPQYPSDATTVVNITTVSSPNDQIYLNVANTTDIRHRISDTPSVDFKMQVKNFTSQLSYRYEYLQPQFSDMFSRVFDEQYFRLDLKRSRSTLTTDKVHRLNWSGEIQCAPHNRLGIYLYYNDINRHSTMSGSDYLLFGHIPTPELVHSFGSIVRDDYTDSRIISGAITYDFNNHWLSAHFSQGLLTSAQDFLGHITESVDKPSRNRTEQADVDYHGANTNIDLNVKLPWQTSISAGWRYSYVKTQNDKLYENMYWSENNHITSDLTLKSNLMHIVETDNQAYFAVARRAGRWTIIPGGRLLWVNRDIKDQINNYLSSGIGIDDGETTFYNKNHTDLLPSLSIRYAGDDASMSLDYTRRIRHPAFHMLNSGVIYEDSLTMYMSNSHLSSTITDELRLSASRGNLSAEVGFSRLKNPIAEVEYMFAPIDGYINPQAFRGPVNLAKSDMLSLNASYSSAVGALTYYGTAGLNIPLSATGTGANNLPWADVMCNVTYRLGRHLSFFLDYKLQTGARWMVYERSALNRLNLGLTAAACADRLHISLEGTDLLASEHNGALTTTYRSTVSTKMSRGDMRGISLRLSYTLFNNPIRTRQTKANSDIIDRIE